MPHGDPDPVDPMMLNGMVFETDSDEATREMAENFVDEYLRLGFTTERVRSMFDNSGFVGPHMAIQTLGAEAIDALIDEVAQRWGPFLGKRTTDQNEEGDVLLPVLE